LGATRREKGWLKIRVNKGRVYSPIASLLKGPRRGEAEGKAGELEIGYSRKPQKKLR